ncbi:hypothetical protein GQ44DRAFT_779855 [Phaeosphaeriaceae sp. PMI808]|nr:hypothetical protein GQ44DRAFT_779855 [Phaeosphaeriaceae sp. PMI808]
MSSNTTLTSFYTQRGQQKGASGSQATGASSGASGSASSPAQQATSGTTGLAIQSLGFVILPAFASMFAFLL